VRLGDAPLRAEGNERDLPGVRLRVQADFLILMDEMGSGSDMSIRVPQLGQCMEPACSSTLGTVVNIREQLGHFTLMILTNGGS
jgi:hypothetical protein